MMRTLFAISDRLFKLYIFLRKLLRKILLNSFNLAEESVMGKMQGKNCHKWVNSEHKKKVAKWKTPDADSVQGLWLKKFVFLQSWVAKNLNGYVRSTVKLLEWMSKRSVKR